jgi:DNA ligase (NAD+)
MGEKSAKNLLNALSVSKQTTLRRFLFGIGIRDVGETTAGTLESHFGSLSRLMSASEAEVQEAPDVGPVIAAHIYSFFRQPHNIEVIDALRRSGVQWPEHEPKKTVEGHLVGKTFVITGTLPTMSRDEAKDKIIAKGGKVSDSVSKKTSFVVVGAEAGSKLKKAQDLGLTILDEAALQAILNE